MKLVTVIVSTEGTITIDTVGFTGADCEQATKFLVETLGTKTSHQHKPEYLAHRASKHLQDGGEDVALRGVSPRISARTSP